MKKGQIYYVSEQGFWMLGRCDDETDYDDGRDGRMRCYATFLAISPKEFVKNGKWCYKSDSGRNYREATSEEVVHFLECEKTGKFAELPKPEKKPKKPTINDSYSIF